MLELAKNRKLALRLPEDRKSADKVLKKMEQAALADHNVTASEQALLKEVRDRIARIGA
jgi:hypothetical protein